MIKAMVTESHTPAQRPALVVKAGDGVRLGRTDEEWPGWIWCESEEGVGGWAPESYLAREGRNGRFLVDYDATELTAQPGELLTLHHEVNGWWWVTDEEGRQGWVPAEKITPAGA